MSASLPGLVWQCRSFPQKGGTGLLLCDSILEWQVQLWRCLALSLPGNLLCSRFLAAGELFSIHVCTVEGSSVPGLPFLLLCPGCSLAAWDSHHSIPRICWLDFHPWIFQCGFKYRDCSTFYKVTPSGSHSTQAFHVNLNNPFESSRLLFLFNMLKVKASLSYKL